MAPTITNKFTAKNLGILNEYNGLQKPKLTASLIKMEFGYPCGYCGAHTSNKQVAQRHKEAHSSGHRCTHCPQVFFTRHIAELHKNLHKKNSNVIYEIRCRCKLCNGIFVSLLNLEFHLIQFHSEEALHNSDVIQLGIAKGEEQVSGLLTATPENMFKCGTCDEIFKYGYNLECHVVLHSEVKFCCAKCSVTFKIIEDLDNHISSKHLNKDKDLNKHNDSLVVYYNPSIKKNTTSKNIDFFLSGKAGKFMVQPAKIIISNKK